MFCSKTTRQALFFWRRMERLQAASARSISIFGISSLPKFRDQIMGVIPARDPGPGKAKPRSGELDTHKVKPRKGKTARKN
jgi:hypothetical protein